MAVTYRAPGVVLTERDHLVPLDHDRPDGPSITVFTREVAVPGGETRPYLLFLQGGPGFEATRPTSPPSGWMKRVLQDYRVLLLDQRGTGRSTLSHGQVDRRPAARGPRRTARQGDGRLPRGRRRRAVGRDALGGLLGGTFGITAPFWFGFIGSTLAPWTRQRLAWSEGATLARIGASSEG
jgi:hypothetical protein